MAKEGSTDLGPDGLLRDHRQRRPAVRGARLHRPASKVRPRPVRAVVASPHNPEIPIAKSVIDYIFRWLRLAVPAPEERANLGLVDRSGTAESSVQPLTLGFAVVRSRRFWWRRDLHGAARLRRGASFTVEWQYRRLVGRPWRGRLLAGLEGHSPQPRRPLPTRQMSGPLSGRATLPAPRSRLPLGANTTEQRRAGKSQWQRLRCPRHPGQPLRHRPRPGHFQRPGPTPLLRRLRLDHGPQRQLLQGLNCGSTSGCS